MFTTHISYLSNVVFHIYPTVNILKRKFEKFRDRDRIEKRVELSIVFLLKVNLSVSPYIILKVYETDADLG